MKRNNYLFSIILGIALFLGAVVTAYGQVTVASSDSLDCTHPCTELRASLIGDSPINADITMDDYYQTHTLPIGFNFNFYGNTYWSCLVGPNGTVCFDTSLAGAYDDWEITAVLAGNPTVYNSVCGPWCDIYIPAGGTITYSTVGVAPNRRFIATYCHAAMYSCTTQWTTSQIMLYETSNLVEVHVGHKTHCSWNGGYAIIGVENETGSASTAAPGRDYPMVYTCTDEAWRFTPVGGGTSYSVASIPYAPIPYDTSTLYWYNATTGAYIGTGDSINVCPTTPILYKCGALGCSDTSFGYYLVTPRGGVAFTTTVTNPSKCGSCDGTITLHGLTPGMTDSVAYDLGAVPQTSISAVVTAAGTITLTGLCAGIYDSLKVKAGTCWSAPAIDTLTNPAISMAGTSTNPTICGACNGTITLTGLYASTTYILNYTLGGVAQPALTIPSNASGTITLTGLCAGVYADMTATILSAGACVTPAVGPLTLTNPAITMTGVSTNNSFCGVCDGTIVLSGLYGSTTYTITYALGGVAQPAITLASTAAGVITLTGLCAGAYSNIIATITSSGGACVTPPVGPLTITPPPTPLLNIVSSTNPSQCGLADGTITIKSISPFSTDTVFYSYNSGATTSTVTIALADSAIVLTGLPAGTYTGFTVKIGSCIYNVSGTADLVGPTLHALFDTSVHFGCHGDTVLFTNSSSTTPAGGLLYYLWKFGDGTSDTSASPTHVFAQGAYTVTLVVYNPYDNPTSCADSMVLPISLIHPLVASFIDSPVIICQDELITFTNTSLATSSNNGAVSDTAGHYLWAFGTGASASGTNATFTYQNVGTYTVELTATDWVPCTATTTAIIQVDTISPIHIAVTDTAICQGTYITYTGLYATEGNTGNIWSFGDGSAVADVNPVTYGFNATGVFTISVTATYRACQSITASRTVTVLPVPYINLGPDTSICIGSEPLILTDNVNSGNPAASWLWSTGQAGPSITVVAPGYYYATVNINNCYAADTIWVQNDCYMDIPNVFSPNGDGINDYFYPRQYLTKGLTTFSMNIYNRWGELIFQSNTLDGRGWDGKFNNVSQPEGVYIYVIDATFKDGQKEHHQGNLTLLR